MIVVDLLVCQNTRNLFHELLNLLRTCHDWCCLAPTIIFAVTTSHYHCTTASVFESLDTASIIVCNSPFSFSVARPGYLPSGVPVNKPPTCLLKCQVKQANGINNCISILMNGKKHHMKDLVEYSLSINKHVR